MVNVKKMIALLLLATAGCKGIMPKLSPVEKRNGRPYTYTRDFFKGPGHQVEFFRQPLDALYRGGNGQWGISPSQLFMGLAFAVPLALADWLVASPVIDTALLPYDVKRTFDEPPKAKSVQEDAP